MAFSSAEEAIIRGSPSPHLSPPQVSAIHPATQALSHNLAANEEADPLLRSSSSHTTFLSSQHNPPQPASSLTALQPSASPATPPSVPPKKRRHAWTSEQDALLIALVKQHGPRWVRIVAQLNKTGGPQRNAVGALKRHARLVDRQSSTASSSSSGLAPSSFSSSSAPQQAQHEQQQQQQQHQQPPTLPAAAQRWSRKGCKPKRWTSEEDAVLAAISQTYEKQWQIYRAFKEALPGTERTEWAVLARWNQTYHRGRTGRGDGGVNGGGGVGDQRTEAAAVARGENGGGAAMVADMGEAATYEDPHQAEGVVPAWPLSPSTAQDSAMKTSQPVPPSTVNYTIDYLWNGFLIRNFPPYHELRIHSPTSCQVIEPDVQADSPNREPEEEQKTAPFVFTVESTGLVQALALPAGTRTSIAILEKGDEDDHGGGAGGKGGHAKVVEARFEGQDGYIVVFQTELSS